MHQVQRPGTTTAKLSAMLLASALTGCLADDSSGPQAMACESLAGIAVAATAIGLPTSGARVTSAATVAASVSNPAYCKVLGAIDPVDPSAPKINFQVNLPASWNQKAVHYGGGGYNGTLVSADGGSVHTANAGTPIPTPIARGYATFGSDSGHQSPGLSAAFAANAEALDNWAGASLKKVHDVAHHLIGKRYGSMPVRQYFAGGSQGGHEGFLVVQRYPKDYDGVIAYYPAYNFTGGVFNANHTTKAWFTVPGAALSAGKVGALNSAVLAACDALDGAVDELVSNTAACRAVFDVAALRCPSCKPSTASLSGHRMASGFTTNVAVQGRSRCTV